MISGAITINEITYTYSSYPVNDKVWKVDLKDPAGKIISKEYEPYKVSIGMVIRTMISTK